MKFLLRCLLVLAVAVGLGFLLFNLVQAMPGLSNPPNFQRPPENGQSASPNLPPRTERPENDRSRGFSFRAIFGIAGRVMLFSVIVFASVIAKNFLFERKPTIKRND